MSGNLSRPRSTATPIAISAIRKSRMSMKPNDSQAFADTPMLKLLRTPPAETFTPYHLNHRSISSTNPAIPAINSPVLSRFRSKSTPAAGDATALPPWLTGPGMGEPNRTGGGNSAAVQEIDAVSSIRPRRAASEGERRTARELEKRLGEIGREVDLEPT